MSDDGCIVVVGGTDGIGQELARYYAGTGRETILSGRDAARAAAVAAEIGGRRAASPLTWPSRRRSGTRWRRSVRSATWPSSRSSATTTPSATSTSTGRMRAGDAQAGRLRGGRPRPARPPVTATARSCCSAARPRTGRIRVDDRLDRQRRDRPGWRGRWPGSWRRSGSTPSTRASPATARSGTASRPRSSKATCRRPSPRSWRRWTISSTARGSCSRTRRRRHRSRGRQRQDDVLTMRS